MYTASVSVLFNVLTGALLLLAVASTRVVAQNETGDRSPDVVGTIGTEIHEIRIDSNTVFDDEILLGLLSSRATTLGPFDTSLDFHARHLLEHPNSGDGLKHLFRKFSKYIDQFRQYFDRVVVEADVEDIIRLYDVNGYHKARARAYIEYDPKGRHNTLVFEVHENAPARLDTVVWLGLNELPAEVSRRIESAKTDSLRGVLRSSILSSESDRVLNVLRNNGYFFAERRRPVVSFDEQANSDSITVRFITGPRVRVGKISFIDSTRGQRGVSQSTRRRQLEFSEGDWYSAENVDVSVQNIYDLGTYERVSIDTVAMDLPDSTIDLQVFTVTRDLGEYGATIIFDKGFNEDYWNLGAEANVLYRNLAGGAQSIRLFGRVSIVDFTGWITEGFTTVATEWQTGLEFEQPYLTSVLDRPVDGGMRFQYLRRTVPIDKFDLTLQTIELPVQFGMRFHRYNFIQKLGLVVGYVYERPINLADDRANFLDAGADIDAVDRILYQYELLEQNQVAGFTAVTTEVSLFGDARNHPFSPTKGYLMTAGGKFGVMPKSSFMFKMDFNLLAYRAMTSTGTSALKLRMGHIFWVNKDNGGPIPANDMYFAGGSSSIRAWNARELRTEPVNTDFSSDRDIREAAMQTGSGSLLELSVEWRQRLSSRTKARSEWDKQLLALGVVGFIDAGNTDNSLLQKAEGYTNNPIEAFGNIFSEMAVGVGVGLRYDLPFGPFRFDLATRMHDPMRTNDAWIWDRPLRFYWRVGIGHAF